VRKLYWDIETAPHHALIYDLKNAYVSLDQVLQPGRILCFAARWNTDRRSTFYSEWDLGRLGMLTALRDLLDEADVSVTFNGVNYDEPYARKELLEVGLASPSPFYSLDLWRETRRFRFMSSKLQHISDRLLGDSKVQHGGMFNMYRKAVLEEGTEAEVAKFRRLYRRYNIQDVDLMVPLEEILSPWIKVPNRALIDGNVTDGPQCPLCGGTDVQRRGVRPLLTGVYQQYQCNADGKWFRSTHREYGTTNVGVQS
jgi:hypothetical protein